ATHHLAAIYFEQGKLTEAEPLCVRLLESHRKLIARGQPGLPTAPLNWVAGIVGDGYERAGQFAKAESFYREVLETLRQRGEEGSSDGAALKFSLAWSFLQQHRYADSEPLFRDVLRFRTQHEPDRWQTFSTKSGLGASLLGQKKYAEAEPL